MSANVKELQGLNQNIQQFKPWFDDSFTGLSVMRQLTLAFPENGAVTAKTIEIHDGNVVTCTGTTQSQAALLNALNTVARGGRRDKSHIGAAPRQGASDAVHV